MSFHLEGPWLSTTGKRKGKVKFKSAEHAKKSRELDASWKELLKRQGVEIEEKKRKRGLAAEPLGSSYSMKPPAGRETTEHIKSREQDNGVAPLKDRMVYSGTACIGIATMHKSNAVPVFSNEEAAEISRMRRG